METKEIIKGILREPTDLSKERMEICLSCEYVTNKYETVFGPRCSECGCILKFKVKSDSKCPQNKW